MPWQHASNSFATRIERFGNTQYFCNAHQIILYPKSSNASIVSKPFYTTCPCFDQYPPMQYISPCATSITMKVSTKLYELTVDLPHTNIVQVLLGVSGQHTRRIGGILAYTCITTSYIVVSRTESRVCCKEQTITVAFRLQVRYA